MNTGAATRLILLLAVAWAAGCGSVRQGGPSGFLNRGSDLGPVVGDELLANAWERTRLPDSAPWFGWLWSDPSPCGEPVSYLPREGDLVLMTSRSPAYSLLYALGGAKHPLHMGMVVRRSCGELAILESGGSEDKRVTLLPVESRFCQYLGDSRDGLIWIRPVRGELCPCQSQALTCFAESQLGKEFATVRSAMFVMPGDPKLETTPDQEKWFCSELVIEGLKQAGLVRGLPRPAAILPEDVYHNRNVDLDFYWLPAVQWTAVPELPVRRPFGAPLRPE